MLRNIQHIIRNWKDRGQACIFQIRQHIKLSDFLAWCVSECVRWKRQGQGEERSRRDKVLGIKRSLGSTSDDAASAPPTQRADVHLGVIWLDRMH